MQRFCLTLQLRSDPQLIAEYEARHQAVSTEVLHSLQQAGVLQMQIFRQGEQLFMVMDTQDDFSFERKAALDRSNPAVMVWEREMAQYQRADPEDDASGKWVRLSPLFDFAEQTKLRREET